MKSTETTLRVLLVTWSYFPDIGGIPTHVHEIGKRLVAKGVDVTLLTTDRSGCLGVNANDEGIKIRRVRAWPNSKDLYFAPGIYQEILAGNWDIIHCQGYQTLVPPIAMLAALKAKIPYVLTFHPGGHSSLFFKVIKGIQWALLSPLIARAERLIVTAEWEKDFFMKQMHLAQEKFTLIPNGGTLPQLEKSLPVKSRDGTLIVSVGRLERYKGHQRVIAALPEVLKKYPDTHLRIAGAGPYESTLRKLAHDIGVSDRVRIGVIPSSDRQQLAAMLSKAKLFILLSEYEGNPMSVIEALTLGCPVLVSDHPGLQEFANCGLARSIPLKSTPNQVANAIIDQLKTPLIPSNFRLSSWDDCATKLYALYAGSARRRRCAF